MLRYLSGRAHTRDEVVASHGRRMAHSRKVPGLGYWMAFGTDGGVRGSARPATEDAGQSLGLMMLPPAHGPDAASRGVMAAVGMSYVRTYFPQWEEPLAGAEEGEVEYELTAADWRAQAPMS